MKIKTGLWKTESKKGNNYYKGKIKINNTDYTIAVFKNENKKSDTSPDLMIYLDEKESVKTSYTVDEIVNAEEFGKGTENISDDDIAF